MNPALQFAATDWLTLFWHFAALSLLAVGGAITTVADMHRYQVVQQQWLSDAQFGQSIALAQAAPGPNVLFVALMGFNIGLNNGSHTWAALGVLLAMAGTLAPSCLLTFMATRWGHRNRERREVRAFKAGLAPIVVALLVATGWVLSTALAKSAAHWPIWAVSAATALLVWRTKIHLLWLLGAGGLLGWFGLL
jgi:chromate transporter